MGALISIFRHCFGIGTMTDKEFKKMNPTEKEEFIFAKKVVDERIQMLEKLVGNCVLRRDDLMRLEGGAFLKLGRMKVAKHPQFETQRQIYRDIQTELETCVADLNGLNQELAGLRQYARSLRMHEQDAVKTKVKIDIQNALKRCGFDPETLAKFQIKSQEVDSMLHATTSALSTQQRAMANVTNSDFTIDDPRADDDLDARLEAFAQTHTNQPTLKASSSFSSSISTSMRSVCLHQEDGLPVSASMFDDSGAAAAASVQLSDDLPSDIDERLA